MEDIREAALADDAIDVECLLRRQDGAGLITSNVAMYNKMHEWSLYPFEAEFIELKDTSITGDALSAKYLNDAAALSYVIELVTERFQQYDLLNLFSKFLVLDMAIISTGGAWTSTFIDLFKWLDDLELETVCKSVKWIRQFLNDVKWSRDISWSRQILLKACTLDLKQSI